MKKNREVQEIMMMTSFSKSAGRKEEGRAETTVIEPTGNAT